jgi:chromosome segregation ATPase
MAEGRVMKSFLLLISLLLLSFASQVPADELYYWVDETGKIHIVDEVRRIPKAHRDRVKTYRSPSRSTRTTALEETAPRVSETPQEAASIETSKPAPAEPSKTIEALQQRERELTEERTRLKGLETRFRTKSSRSVIYQKRIEQLDEEAEAIQKELDAIRPKEP